MAICRPQVLYRACSVGETSSIIKTLLGEIFITHGFSSLCGQTRGVERNPDSALSYSHVPPLCLGPSITALPSDSQSLSLRAQSPRNELSSGKHLTRDFRKLFREIVRKTSSGWETALKTKGPGRQARIFMWTNDSGRLCLGKHIKTYTIWIFTRVSLYLFPVHNCSFGVSFYLPRPARPGLTCSDLSNWTCSTRCIEQYVFHMYVFMVQNSGLMLRPLTLVKPLNSHHISSLCHAGVTQWCFNSVWHVMMSRSLLVTRVSWRMGRKC